MRVCVPTSPTNKKKRRDKEIENKKEHNQKNKID
jgi:hypothetical protein